MFRRMDKDLCKLLTERYFEADFCSCNVRDYPGYLSTTKNIIAVEKKILEKYPNAGDDLEKMLALYISINEVKDQYFFEEGVGFAMDMIIDFSRKNI